MRTSYGEEFSLSCLVAAQRRQTRRGRYGEPCGRSPPYLSLCATAPAITGKPAPRCRETGSSETSTHTHTHTSPLRGRGAGRQRTRERERRLLFFLLLQRTRLPSLAFTHTFALVSCGFAATHSVSPLLGQTRLRAENVFLNAWTRTHKQIKQSARRQHTYTRASTHPHTNLERKQIVPDKFYARRQWLLDYYGESLGDVEKKWLLVHIPAPLSSGMIKEN